MQDAPLKSDYKQVDYTNVLYFKIKGKEEVKIVDGDFVYFLDKERETVHILDCKNGDLVGLVDVESIEYIYITKENKND